MFALFSLIACGVGDLDVTSSTEACTDHDFINPAKSQLTTDVAGSTVLVWRTYVERDNADDVFAPEIIGEGNVLEVYEAWEAGSDGQEWCLEPRVTIRGLTGTLEVQWYTDSESVPFDTVEVEPG